MTRIYLIILISALIVSGCSESSTNSSLKPTIESINPSSTFIGGVVTLYGKDFGFYPSNTKIVLNDSIYILSENCEKWNNGLIRFTIPDSTSSCKLYIVKGKDTSNMVAISITAIPEIKMSVIPAGEFMMGSKTGLYYELPVHNVKISKSFSISKYEVNQFLWVRVMGENNSKYQHPDYPAMNVTWLDAVKFCNRLSNITKLDTVYIIKKDTIVTVDTTANGYRLPTEAEWEYVCRAGTTTDYSGNNNLDELGWYNSNSGYYPHFVGSMKPNQFDVYDMHGNVWEWCWDWYSPDYYSVSTSVNPTGPITGSRHILRGGSYSDGANSARSSNRAFNGNDYENCGLRIIKK